MTAAPPRLVIQRALGLGDFLTAVPALRALRRRFPDHRLILAAPAGLEDLLPATGAIDALAPTSGPRTPPWSGPAPELAVNLHGRGPQSIDALRALTPQQLWTHRHLRHPDLGGPVWREDTHEVVRWCRLLEHFQVAADPGDLDLGPPPRQGRRPNVTIVHPGAAHRARRWPQTRFARVAHWLARRGHDVVVTGTRPERRAARGLARQAGLPRGAVLAGTTTLAELAGLVAHARLVLCGDTGIAHLATAYRVPSVVLFGPVSPARWGPPAQRRLHTALWAGRSGDPWSPRTDEGLLSISTSRVIDAVSTQLGESPREGRPSDAGAGRGSRDSASRDGSGRWLSA